MKIATIANLEDATSEDAHTGAVRSVQAADLYMRRGRARGRSGPRRTWSASRAPTGASSSRVTLGLIRVRYTERERSSCCSCRPLKLLTFRAPEYEMDGTRGLVRWRIARGLLVAGRGRRKAATCRSRCAAATARTPHRQRAAARRGRGRELLPVDRLRLGRWVYNATQSRIHVIVTHGFLRSLARLDLAESRVGRFARSRTCPTRRRPRRRPADGQFDLAGRRPLAADRAQLRAVVLARIRRTVPERERITSDSVVAPPALG